ncbi:CPBP family intramembrane metalloprotease [Hymenobacter sp. 15J16-1T3B]|uniref:CPBP family intramembrane glutamic endopeptidase n=1 Tax=Hymenobacter sp. 15J16-1T3B TaxID=2886941 RepID=UPI001D123E4E|nr:CPBP family intramembrane glutamic endopeptidase [Hymenobacter sp. 15J16-1T3B]MCC3157355.1 CPBP family intramembrane metalloprotease [Hymenobacter sp. 15J16-1T3B]
MRPAAPLVKAFAAPWFRLDWRTGAWLLVAFSLLRFALVMHANVTRSYQVVALIFVAMVLLPFLVLTRAGRQQIGLRWPARWRGVLLGAVLGALSCAVLFYLTTLCFGLGEGNSLAYIAQSYSNLPPVLTEQNRLMYFLIFTGPSMIFSPIGEELFYRGLVHECFASSIGDGKASLADSAAFALVHLAHFGLVYVAGGWQLLPGPALLWAVSLFGACLLFSVACRQSSSVLGAVVAHAAFNLAMNYFIFCHILR